MCIVKCVYIFFTFVVVCVCVLCDLSVCLPWCMSQCACGGQETFFFQNFGLSCYVVPRN